MNFKAFLDSINSDVSKDSLAQYYYGLCKYIESLIDVNVVGIDTYKRLLKKGEFKHE